MADFVNKKTSDFAEETDMELTLDNLDGVSGGEDEPAHKRKPKELDEPVPVKNPDQPDQGTTDPRDLFEIKPPWI